MQAVSLVQCSAQSTVYRPKETYHRILLFGQNNLITEVFYSTKFVSCVNFQYFEFTLGLQLFCRMFNVHSMYSCGWHLQFCMLYRFSFSRKKSQMTAACFVGCSNREQLQVTAASCFFECFFRDELYEKAASYLVRCSFHEQLLVVAVFFTYSFR